MHVQSSGALFVQFHCLTVYILPQQGKLLKKAASMLVAEKEQNKRERESALNERVPPLKLSGLSVQELQVQTQLPGVYEMELCKILTDSNFSNVSCQELCKELHRKIDTVDDARYDLEVKVAKNDKEVLYYVSTDITSQSFKDSSLALTSDYVDYFWIFVDSTQQHHHMIVS